MPRAALDRSRSSATARIEGGARRRDSERLTALVHDLRTPLALVLGFAEILQQRGEELEPAQRSEYVERLVAAAGEMRDLLDTERGERRAAD
jgi:K+-sensing histidine kinase KdpD